MNSTSINVVRGIFRCALDYNYKNFVSKIFQMQMHSINNQDFFTHSITL
jgi:hypothetical protein